MINQSVNQSINQSINQSTHLRPKNFRTSLFRDSYLNRIVILWNVLPVAIPTAQAFSSFLNQLYKFYFGKLISVFDTDRIQT